MDRILTWNVRGINGVQKQIEVRSFIHQQYVGLVGLLESKIKASNLGSLYQRMFSGWCFTSNSSFHDNGRILVAWKPGVFTLDILGGSSQVLQCLVKPVSGLQQFYCSFVYVFNDSYMRKELWEFPKKCNTDEPWIICGDMNCVMHVEERIGAPVRRSEMEHITNICMNVK